MGGSNGLVFIEVVTDNKINVVHRFGENGQYKIREFQMTTRIKAIFRFQRRKSKEEFAVPVLLVTWVDSEDTYIVCLLTCPTVKDQSESFRECL